MVRLIPRNVQFYDYFRQAADNADEVGKRLVELLFNYQDVAAKVEQLEDLEHRGDEITHQVLKMLNVTFLTPIDRDDISELVNRLDDFVDAITAAAGRLVLYRVEQPTEPPKLFGRIISEQATALASAISLFGDDKRRREILVATVEANRLEDEADDVLNQAMAGVYDDAHDVKSVIKAIHWREIYQRLEDATDRGEDLANTLEGIALK
ncbi:MAG TPA: DUF47 family protein [Thermomicrobiaceae bacterium]|nr:DUF47 family protein [Thermomicrobiaceae bacterium]